MVKLAMNEKFAEQISEIDDLISRSQRPGFKIAARDMLELWRKLYESGIQGYDFAHAALTLALTTMTYHDTLDQNLKFGESLKEAGVSKIRAVSTHWPPVDPDAWPDEFPK